MKMKTDYQIAYLRIYKLPPGETRDYLFNLNRLKYGEGSIKSMLIFLTKIRDDNINNNKPIPEEAIPYIQTREQAEGYDLNHAQDIKERILLFNESWLELNDHQYLAISNFGRLAANEIRQTAPPGIGGNRARDSRDVYLLKPKNKTQESVYIESMVYKYFLNNGKDVALSGEPTYLIHLDRDERNNRADNLKGASFDEYHDYMEEVMSVGTVRWRTLRLDRPGFSYNPFYPRQYQTEMLTRYVVSETGSITSTLLKEESNERLTTPNAIFGDMIHIRNAKKLIDSVVPLSLVLLDTFKGIHTAKNYPIFIDGDTKNLNLDNLKHGTKQEYRDHMLKLIIEKYPEEQFTNVGKQQWGTHYDYIISDKGRVYSLITGRWLNYTFASGIHAGISLNGKRYLKYRVVWTAFNGKIPDGKVLVHKDTTNLNDDSLSNLECVEKGTITKRLEINQEALSEGSPSSNLSLIDLPNEQWARAPTNTVHIKNLPKNVHVSTYGRIKYNNTIIEQHYFSSYLSIFIDSARFLVHRLVAISWIENENPGEWVLVNHIDHNRNNNTITNLEWVTPIENSIHGNGVSFVVENIKTNKSYYFPSILEARKHGVAKEKQLAKAINQGHIIKGIYKCTRVAKIDSVRATSYFINNHHNSHSNYFEVDDDEEQEIDMDQCDVYDAEDDFNEENDDFDSQLQSYRVKHKDELEEYENRKELDILNEYMNTNE